MSEVVYVGVRGCEGGLLGNRYILPSWIIIICQVKLPYIAKSNCHILPNSLYYIVFMV